MTFNKDKARAEWVKKNPGWAKRRHIKPLKINSIMLEKIIALYPDTDNMIIADMVGIPIANLSYILSKLRKSNLIGSKVGVRPSIYSELDGAIDKLAKRIK